MPWSFVLRVFHGVGKPMRNEDLGATSGQRNCQPLEGPESKTEDQGQQNWTTGVRIMLFFPKSSNTSGFIYKNVQKMWKNNSISSSVVQQFPIFVIVWSIFRGGHGLGEPALRIHPQRALRRHRLLGHRPGRRPGGPGEGDNTILLIKNDQDLQ